MAARLRLIVAVAVVPATVASLAWVEAARAERGQFDRTEANPADEAVVFTPSGFERPGQAVVSTDESHPVVRISIRDRATGQPTFCRLNVIGADGNFYQPSPHPYAAYSLTGEWPRTGAGNRVGKAPIRYFGRFFYSNGDTEVRIPPGQVRIEVEKGFEYTPAAATVALAAGERRQVTIELQNRLRRELGSWHGGDPHLHFPRTSEADDRLILDLLQAEDIRYGVVMCYNETDTYSGAMAQLVMPQLMGLGRRSIRHRDDDYWIVSGQEYRNAVYGHINLFLRDDLVLAGQSLDPNHWPVFGLLGAETRRLGGYAIHAHGGYAQEIYADCILQNTTGVELLQFGIYRGIGLDGWYHLLNCGFRFPAVGACDYPACRKLGDCRTYVELDAEQSIEAWLQGMGKGRSFVTSGPLLLLEVAGEKPGGTVDLGEFPTRRLDAQVRIACEVADIQEVEVIEAGRVVWRETLAPQRQPGAWTTYHVPLEVDRPTWFAARVYSRTRSGAADSEAHTNPVYVRRGRRLPWSEASARWLTARLDEQIAEHAGRQFTQRDQVVAYFRAARDRLAQLDREGGLTAAE